MPNGISARYIRQIAVSVMNGTVSSDAAVIANTASASRRMFFRTLSDDQLKVATFDIIRNAISRTQGPMTL